MKITKESLEEQATKYLREKILVGEFKMGTKLVESTLAKDLELSRSTVRMALNSLAHEGLVLQKPYVGWQVIELNAKDLWELYHVRIALETRSAWLAAENITDEGKVHLNEFMKHYIEVGKSKNVTVQEMSRLDFDLHTLIMKLSDNYRLEQIYTNVANLFLIYVNLEHIDYDPLESATCHIPLVDAICAGDCSKAAKLAEENISNFSTIENDLEK